MVFTRSPEETGQLGQLLGRLCHQGTIIGLIGNLGAGKTRLVQGIAEGLEVNPLLVNSPTFTLIQEYEGRFPSLTLIPTGCDLRTNFWN